MNSTLLTCSVLIYEEENSGKNTYSLRRARHRLERKLFDERDQEESNSALRDPPHWSLIYSQFQEESLWLPVHHFTSQTFICSCLSSQHLGPHGEIKPTRNRRHLLQTCLRLGETEARNWVSEEALHRIREARWDQQLFLLVYYPTR